MFGFGFVTFCSVGSVVFLCAKGCFAIDMEVQKHRRLFRGGNTAYIYIYIGLTYSLYRRVITSILGIPDMFGDFRLVMASPN